MRAWADGAFTIGSGYVLGAIFIGDKLNDLETNLPAIAPAPRSKCGPNGEACRSRLSIER